MFRYTLFLLFFLTIATYGQQIQLLDTTTSELIDNDLLSVAVDHQGNKWIGTSKHGLLKFDGKTFTRYYRNNSVIQGNYISPIYVDKKGRVWISFSQPERGIAMFDGSQWVVHNNVKIKNFSAIAICEDTTGTLYVGGHHGIALYDGEKWKRLELPRDTLMEYIVGEIDIHTDGTLAAGHNGGLLIRKENKWEAYSDNPLQLSTVRAVKFNANGDLYIGYGGGYGDGGFSIMSHSTWRHYNKMNSQVPDHMVRDIEFGPDKTIWMATNNGVIKMKETEITPLFFRVGMYKNVIRDIAVEGTTIWIATTFGLVKYSL